MKLISLIELILKGKSANKHLPEGKVTTFDLEGGNKEYALGSFLEVRFGKKVLNKLLYLQTLSMDMRKVGGYPQLEELPPIKKKHPSKKEKLRWKSESLMAEIQKRSNLWDDIGVLENLIVMIVEQNAPSEVKHHGVRYRVNSEGRVRRVAISEPQYLKGVIIPA